ncbi:MAG: hypothetical protein A2Y86_08095 [Candidatus Aminicenantes bacterium RBG_13_62_12]|nr:MAG: hypothetical protein A2Y86_08095 [Candidatus Aminicenantes bacterium RBG_13_62_12]
MIRRSCVVVMALLALGLVADAATLTLPLSQVKPGMKGRGKSVFQGAVIEEFDVEILGVLANIQPKRNVILARLRGRGLETTGIIAGMSGSPVYVDGKLIGAVAYGFSFSKEAIAGITPIDEMLAIDRATLDLKTGGAIAFPIRDDISQEELSRTFLRSLEARPQARSAGLTIAPLELPLMFSGFSAGAFERARSFFAPLGFRAVRAGTGGDTRPGQPPGGPSLREGDAVGVQLLGGDLDISAVGTATYVDGAKVLAFGHPLYNLGAVDYAMTTAEVITVMPSLESSFKLTSTGPVIGRFSQDRTPGAAGEVGVMPRLIPLNISLQSGPAVRKDYKLKLVNDKFLTPALVNIAVSTLITSEERSLGDLALDFDADVFLDKGGMSVHLEDLFSGSYDNSPVSLSGLVAAAVHYLMNNEFKDVGIFRIDLNVRVIEESRLCALEKVLLDKYEVSPGEPIQLKVFYRTQKEESLMEEVTVQTPALPAGTEFQIIVGDAASMQQVERAQYRIQDFVPRSLSQLVRILSNLRKNNRIYFKIIASKPGLFLKGEEMPNLPPTLKSMFASPRAAVSSQTEITRSTLSEYQLPVPYVFKGGATIPVKIRK